MALTVRRLKGSLRIRLGLMFLSVAGLAAALGGWPARLSGSAVGSWLLVVGIALVPAFWLAGRVLRPIRQVLRALSGTVASYREGDFSQSLVVERDDELGELMAGH